MERVKTTGKIKGIGKKRNKSNIFEAIVVLLLFIVHVWGFWDYDGIVVLMDEFGYWEHAASMAGYDWTGVMTGAPWYSWGYSLLLLPLFWLCEKMSTMYHIAILMNGCMMVGVYFIVKDLAKKIYNDLTPEINILVAVSVCLYSPYVAQSKVAWAETSICFVFWLLVWCMAKCIEKDSIAWCMLTSVMAGIVYIFHNRMIVVVIALLLVAFVMKVCGKVKWQTVITLVIPVVALYFLNDVVKTALQSQLQLSTELNYALNDISGRAWRLKALLDIDGIKNAIFCAGGELVYVNLATFMIGIIGILFVLKEVVQTVKEKNIESGRFYFFLFILLVFLGEWGISTLVNMPIGDSIETKGVSYVYYGRYLDGMIGIFILLGLLSIIKECTQNSSRKIILCILAMLAATIIIYRYSLQFVNEVNGISVPGIWYLNEIEGMNIIKWTMLMDLFIIVVVCVWNRNTAFKSFMFPFAFIIFTLIVGTSYVGIYMKEYRQHKEDVFLWAENNIEQNKVYCLANSRAEFYTQWTLPDEKINMITEEELVNLEKDCFVVAEQAVYGENLHNCINNDMYYIFVTDGDVYADLMKNNLLEKKREVWYIDDLDVGLNGFYEPEKGGWVWMNGEKSQVVGKLEKGTYKVDLCLGPKVPLSALNRDDIKLKVYINNQLAEEIVITEEKDELVINCEISEEMVKSGDNILEFQVDETWSPAEYGANDQRQLGISIKKVVFTEN